MARQRTDEMANDRPEQAPDFLVAAHAVAEHIGLHVERFLKKYRETIMKQNRLKQHCLKSGEIQILLQEGILPHTHISHIRSCSDCSAVIEASIPEDTGLQQFLDEAGRKWAEEWREEGERNGLAPHEGMDKPAKKEEHTPVDRGGPPSTSVRAKERATDDDPALRPTLPSTVFTNRLEQHDEEKKFIAEDFSAALAQRVKKLTESHDHVIIAVDSGSTIFYVLASLFKTLKLLYATDRDNSWIGKIRFCINGVLIPLRANEYLRRASDIPSSDLITNIDLLPGHYHVQFENVYGDETVNYLERYLMRDDIYRIALTSSSWIRIRGTAETPGCPLLMARDRDVVQYKEKLINTCDETYIVSALGKIIMGQKDELNRMLCEFERNFQPYKEVSITKDAADIHLVTTLRPLNGYILGQYSGRVYRMLTGKDIASFYEAVGTSRTRTTEHDLIDLPNTISEERYTFLLYKELPRDEAEQFKKEFSKIDIRILSEDTISADTMNFFTAFGDNVHSFAKATQQKAKEARQKKVL